MLTLTSVRRSVRSTGCISDEFARYRRWRMDRIVLTPHPLITELAAELVHQERTQNWGLPGIGEGERIASGERIRV